jgi:hypothetical protein
VDTTQTKKEKRTIVNEDLPIAGADDLTEWDLGVSSDQKQKKGTEKTEEEIAAAQEVKREKRRNQRKKAMVCLCYVDHYVYSLTS